MNYLLLTGREHKQLTSWNASPDIKVHREMLPSLNALVSDAKSAGIEIGIASGFRGYDRQRSIWNAKAGGHRNVFNRDEELLEPARCSPKDLLEAIMSWSAIPGASRHHWGTEVDIFDASVKPKEQVQLTQTECEQDFSLLYAWVAENLHRYPFHRPYEKDLGGVAMEPWHLSFTPLSEGLEQAYDLEVFKRNIAESDICLKDLILDDVENIFSRFIKNVAPPN